ncbi:hypothetical protein CPT_Privateer_143 [Proteus phage Privateer]|uniref:Uncharacterized protein n=1 Tax=Proteus phage Privateer TaxID=2712958 RepID=A0A6G8R435_9CAUD|nr:hypothetical protein HWD17_gp113 [Proteus phage Privateer]QIN94933.1 hypothetical protein CPT_Privateer_143 [Proteus phage Privateer]
MLKAMTNKAPFVGSGNRESGYKCKWFITNE